MLNIFQLKDDQPYITAEGVNIPEFKAVWESDKSEDKTTAQKKLAYIYHMSSWASAYSNLGPEREAEVRKDYLGNIKVDKKMEAAIEKYRKLQMTPELRLLESAFVMTDNLSTHFKTVNFAEEDERGQLKHSSRVAMQNLKDLAKMVESLQKLRKDVQKGLAELGANNGFGVTDNLIDEYLDL